MGIAAVILDMDGVILDTEAIDQVLWPRAAAQFGYDFSSDFYCSLVGRNWPDCRLIIMERFGPQFPLREFLTCCAELWEQHVAVAGVPIKPGLFELLSFLGQRGLAVAVATSSHRENAVRKLHHAGLNQRFPYLVTGEDVAKGKPAPDIYLEAARRLGVDPVSCVAIEDSDYGIFSASTAGMHTLLIPDVTEPSPDARRLAFRVLSSLHEVPDVIRFLAARD